MKKVYTTSMVAVTTILIVLFAILLVISTQRADYRSKLISCEKKASVSITFEELDEIKELKICSYIKQNYRRIPPTTASLIAKNIVKLAKESNIPVSAIVGIIEIESNFDPSQVSSAKARGLMQVRWSVWKDTLKKEINLTSEFDLHKIDNGILSGILVLKYYIDKNSGDLSGALYDYVGKNKDYVGKVYKSIGRFMLYE